MQSMTDLPGTLPAAVEPQAEPIWILRIYLRRRKVVRRRRGGFFSRLFGSSLSSVLVTDAFSSGIQFATVTLGHIGYAPGAKRVSWERNEVDVETLPTCVELIGGRLQLEEYLVDHQPELKDATIVWLEGAHIAPASLREAPSTI